MVSENSPLSLVGPVPTAETQNNILQSPVLSRDTQKQMGMVIWPTFQKKTLRWVSLSPSF